ncbi:hypothetical protein KIN20_033579, partial [Parelaphostrongylus tenuis]
MKTLFVCGGCFNYTGNEAQHTTHMKKCPCSSAPPGKKVYCDRQNNIFVFEVDGEKKKVAFCEVESFVFYVLTTFRGGDYRPVGYFSRVNNFFAAFSLHVKDDLVREARFRKIDVLTALYRLRGFKLTKTRKRVVVRDRREAEEEIARYIKDRAKATLLASSDLLVSSFKRRLIKEANVGWASLE